MMTNGREGWLNPPWLSHHIFCNKLWQTSYLSIFDWPCTFWDIASRFHEPCWHSCRRLDYWKHWVIIWRISPVGNDLAGEISDEISHNSCPQNLFWRSPFVCVPKAPSTNISTQSMNLVKECLSVKYVKMKVKADHRNFPHSINSLKSYLFLLFQKIST